MMFESLEARQLLSVTAVMKDVVLIVTGTRRADHIEVGLNGDLAPGDTDVVVQGIGEIFAMKGIPLGVLVEAGGGGDDVMVSESMGAQSSITIRGGAGDDDLRIGAYSSTHNRVFGGRGDDKITINDFYGGNVLVHGGAGDDIIQRTSNFADSQTTPAPAKLYGDSGNDRITAGDGHDQLLGGNGDDTLKGGLGDDVLVGGAGKDRLSGGHGKNTLRQH